MEKKTTSSAIGSVTTSRRSFLKGTAALAGLAAMAPGAVGCATTSEPAKVDESGDQHFQGLCRGNFFCEATRRTTFFCHEDTAMILGKEGFVQFRAEGALHGDDMALGKAYRAAFFD